MTIIIFYCLYYQLIIIRHTHKKLQQQQQTIHTAIHDLKTPLNTTYSILDFIALKGTDNRRKSLLQTGKVQIRKLTDIIDSILNTHKEKQNVEIKRTQVSLPELIEEVNREVALLFPGKNISSNWTIRFLYIIYIQIRPSGMLFTKSIGKCTEILGRRC